MRTWVVQQRDIGKYPWRVIDASFAAEGLDYWADRKRDVFYFKTREAAIAKKDELDRFERQKQWRTVL